MRTTLKISILLNLALLGGLIFLLANQRQAAVPSAPALSEAGQPAKTAAVPRSAAPSSMESAPFRWSQLASAKDYQAYIANLRAIGCPEATIEDIVRGDADRAFSWERTNLGLDGSSDGPWSRSREMQLVASLLTGKPSSGTMTVAESAENGMEENNGGNGAAESTAPVQGAVNRVRGGGIFEVAKTFVPSSGETQSPSYPLFLQNPDWSALGFTAEQQAAIAQVSQQFQSEISSLNQNPGDAANQNASTTSTGGGPAAPNPADPAALTQWQKALQDANEQLHGLLGAQAYMAYEQQQYYAWYQPQVAAAAASGQDLTINPAAFH